MKEYYLHAINQGKSFGGLGTRVCDLKEILLGAT